MDQLQIDTLFINGKIYTFRQEGEWASALGIHQGRIVFVGMDQEVLGYTAKKTINLRGKTVIPGLGDSHLHLYAYCQNQTTVRLEDVKSMKELEATLKEKAATTEKGKWIKGTGFDQTKFLENRLPTRWDLDKISTEHPIVIRRCCLHAIVANSLAIEMAQISESQMKEFQGLIEIGSDEALNGIFRETATSIFDEIIPDPLTDVNEKKRILSNVFSDMVSKGITAIHTYAAKIWNYEENINTYKELDEEGALPLRVVVSLDELFEPEAEPTEKDPYRKVKYGSYKLFTDGSLGARSAALMEPYSDDENNLGILVDREKLITDLQTAVKQGLQPAIHAIGDRAMEITLDAIETVMCLDKDEELPPGNMTKRLPFRIIHAQMVNHNQMERLKRLPVVLDIQPIFLCTDLYWIESRLGSERIKCAYLWKTMMENGLMLAGGSDCPVESFDPIKGIYAAVMRQDLNGYPPEGWEPKEKLSVYEAFCLFTKNIAYTTGDEAVLGTIEKNKYADLVVLESDPFQIEPENLKDMKVLMTFVAGEKVYEREEPLCC